MRDWFGFKRRRAELKAAIYEQVPERPTTPLVIVRGLEARTGRMTSTMTILKILHELQSEGAIRSGYGSDNHPRYWRRPS